MGEFKSNKVLLHPQFPQWGFKVEVLHTFLLTHTNTYEYTRTYYLGGCYVSAKVHYVADRLSPFITVYCVTSSILKTMCACIQTYIFMYIHIHIGTDVTQQMT